MPENAAPSFKIICILVLCSGLAALSWEVVWQLKSSLALGVSSWGTAITLAVTMVGMSIGALAAGAVLKNKEYKRPLNFYGVLEIIIGVSGLCLVSFFGLIENFDTSVYQNYPQYALITHIGGILLVLGLPTICMGATIPVLGLVARKYHGSLATLYGLNTLGAALGALIAALLLIPTLGVGGTIIAISCINIAVGCASFLISFYVQPHPQTAAASVTPQPYQENKLTISNGMKLWIVCITGFCTFALEIAWFRSLTAAFTSTTIAFSIMLSCVLIALGLGARSIKLVKMKNVDIGVILALSGIFVLLATPVIERFDYFTMTKSMTPYSLYLTWFCSTFLVIAPSIYLLGISFPWILEEEKSPKRWGAFYGLNAFAAMAGSLTAAWILLPSIGFVNTALFAGGLLIVTGIIIAPRAPKYKLAGLAAASVAIALFFNSGIGIDRVQGRIQSLSYTTSVLKSYNGPDVTTSVIEQKDKTRMLIIDGFVATGQSSAGDTKTSFHYMPWMGHLPMIYHPDPQKALVICFGTGQTANAVRKENPARLDIVDLNENVYKLASYFAANEGVLDDPRVAHHVMDGRAYIRRTTETYDVITLEPMPPSFAGVNALYSQEFYKRASEKMSANGVMAQWMPFHLVSPYYSQSIIKTFQSVFPNAILWKDMSQTAIIIGTKDPDIDLTKDFPGYARTGTSRDLTEEQVRAAVFLNKDQLKQYSAGGDIVTDNNQLLSFGSAVYDAAKSPVKLNDDNYKLIHELTGAADK